MNSFCLIIFIKNPQLGKVKTRLAATIGPQKALEVYQKLLNRTRAISAPLTFTKALYYSDFVPAKDEWDPEIYLKHRQTGSDLGARMEQAFAENFSGQNQRICIIGSDCYELTTTIIEAAFAKLADNDLVIGPARDGGYYLLGMRQPHPFLFKNINWSTGTVLTETLKQAAANGLSVSLLPTLTDVDEEKDLPSLASE